MKVKVIKRSEKKQKESDDYIRRHAKSLRVLLEKKPAKEAKTIVQQEFKKILLHPGQ